MSDELGLTAQGLETFDRKSGQLLVARIRDIVERFDVEEVVVGLPMELSGRSGEAARKAKKLAASIRLNLEIKVTLWDERFSSEEAKRVLKGTGAGKGAVDRLSAVLILQNYLDFLNYNR